MKNRKLNASLISQKKAKYFLIILSILGLLFSYSCKCRNGYDANDDNNGGQIDSTTFTITRVTTNNTVVYSSKSDSITNFQTFKFSEASSHGFTVEVDVSSDGTGITDFTNTELKYDDLTGNLYLTDTGTNKIKALTELEEKNVRIIFKLTATNDKLKNHYQEFTNDIKFVKTKLIKATDNKGTAGSFANLLSKVEVNTKTFTVTTNSADNTVSTNDGADTSFLFRNVSTTDGLTFKVEEANKQDANVSLSDVISEANNYLKSLVSSAEFNKIYTGASVSTGTPKGLAVELPLTFTLGKNVEVDSDGDRTLELTLLFGDTWAD